MINFINDPVYLKMCERLKRRKIDNLYQDPYHRYSRILQYLHRKNLISEGVSCLDLGCLRPELASLLINNYNADVTGIDQWDMKASWPEIKMNFIQTDLAGDFTAYIPKEFDIVFALEVLEHMIDTDLFLERIKKSVKKGGIVAISTPNINNLRNRIMVPLGGYPVSMEYKNIIHHVRLYNVKALKSHLEEHGFEVLDIYGVNFLPYKGLMSNRIYRKISEWLAVKLPALCSNMIAIVKLPK